MYYISMLTNKTNKVLYIGVTNNLARRVYEHRKRLAQGFPEKYHADKLVYYEIFEDAKTAIAREKQLKGWRREKKDALVHRMNPEWKDLYEWE